MEQLNLHEKMDWAIFNYEQKIIVKKTGCEVPCIYKEFAIVGEPQCGNANIFGPIRKK
jgi:hypothetical protein